MDLLLVVNQRLAVLRLFSGHRRVGPEPGRAEKQVGRASGPVPSQHQGILREKATLDVCFCCVFVSCCALGALPRACRMSVIVRSAASIAAASTKQLVFVLPCVDAVYKVAATGHLKGPAAPLSDVRVL